MGEGLVRVGPGVKEGWGLKSGFKMNKQINENNNQTKPKASLNGVTTEVSGHSNGGRK